jgi:hypothetical protein
MKIRDFGLLLKTPEPISPIKTIQSPNKTIQRITNMSNYSIYRSPVFQGAYYVINNETGDRTDCHNLQTALAHCVDQGVQAHLIPVPKQITLEEHYGCLTGGLGYTPAITWTLTGRVERVHNWATAKEIARTFPKKSWS